MIDSCSLRNRERSFIFATICQSVCSSLLCFSSSPGYCVVDVHELSSIIGTVEVSAMEIGRDDEPELLQRTSSLWITNLFTTRDSRFFACSQTVMAVQDDVVLVEDIVISRPSCSLIDCVNLSLSQSALDTGGRDILLGENFCLYSF